jgi:hypothetical protein
MINTPEIVNDIVKAVSAKLGREAISRKVNNREEYFILDLAFSYFQKADRNRRNDYRSGYLYFFYSFPRTAWERMGGTLCVQLRHDSDSLYNL